MNRNFACTLLFGLAIAGGQALAAMPEPVVPAAEKLGCAAPAEYAATANATANANAEAQGAKCAQENHAVAAAGPRVVFQLNRTEDAPTILRFVTNYLAVEPTAQVAVVGYAGGIDFMLKDALDSSGKPYADQLAVLADRGVAFKVCNNTLKARNLTSAAVSPPATVVPGAVNEIIRLQTREGYAYFQN
jgi:intracellular sulfur oxidation DsrE/DsrF family protein